MDVTPAAAVPVIVTAATPVARDFAVNAVLSLGPSRS
jgi:hypothetical protein